MSAQKFRDDRYWLEDVDNIYKSHFTLLDDIYNKFGGHHLSPGEKISMMGDEFEAIFTKAGLINDNFCPRDAYMCFNLSMMCQVNEVEKERHLKANFVEFLEMLGRACEKISLQPLNPKTLDLTEMDDA